MILLKKQVIFIGVVIAIIIVACYIQPFNSVNEGIELTEYIEEEEDVVEEVETHEVNEEISTYLIDVKGQVQFPGVYEVTSDLRVHDVIILAGGFLDTANTNTINLAQKIQDEMVIYVPHLEEETETSFESWSTAQNKQKVSINQATESELLTLPGIGPSKASAIIKYRDEFGKFNSIDELTNVSGIGSKTLENLRDYIEL
ncbi:MAG: helix-hairpin-helix domain-containing protein [Turicibacter sp.]|nr:helix-hairpin-helix domain-containing protein [Turicibacter sp.]